MIFTGGYPQDIEKLPNPEFVVGDFISKNNLSLIYGQPGVGKSLLSWSWAMCMAHGIDWYHLSFKKPRRVLYVWTEWSDIKKRQAAWKLQFNVSRWSKRSRNFLWIKEPINLIGRDNLYEFIQTAKDHGTEHLFLDTLNSMFAGGNENDPKDMTNVTETLRILRDELNCTLYAIHHPTKRGEWERGHGSLRGAMANVFYLLGEPGNNKVCTLKCTKNNCGRIADDILGTPLIKQIVHTKYGQTALIKPELEVHGGYEAPKPPVSKTDAIMSLVEGGAIATFPQIQEALQASKQTTYNYINYLVEHNHLAKISKGQWRSTISTGGITKGGVQ